MKGRRLTIAGNHQTKDADSKVKKTKEEKKREKKREEKGRKTKEEG